MPTYVYECSACGAVFEAEQRISEEPLDKCRECCASGRVKRVIQPVGVMFKGQGFHINDYAAKPSPAEPPKPETPDKSVASTDSKPDAAG